MVKGQRLLGGCEGSRFETRPPPALDPIFSSWSDGRGLLRPALTVEMIGLLFPYQNVLCLFPFRLCCLSYTLHLLYVIWKMGNAGWGLARTPRVSCQHPVWIVLALDYSFTVYSFTDHSEVLPPRHKDVLENIAASVKWLLLYCKAFSSWKATLWKSRGCQMYLRSSHMLVWWVVPSCDGGNVRKRVKEHKVVI